jgi:hypothetical protein
MMPPLAATTTRSQKVPMATPRIGEHNPIQSVWWHCPRNFEALFLALSLSAERRASGGTYCQGGKMVPPL